MMRAMGVYTLFICTYVIGGGGEEDGVWNEVLWTTHNLGRMVGQSSPCSACVGEEVGDCRGL